jgi:serine/threonine protein kinase
LRAGLAHLHENYFIHRDIKPANLLIGMQIREMVTILIVLKTLYCLNIRSGATIQPAVSCTLAQLGILFPPKLTPPQAWTAFLS